MKHFLSTVIMLFSCLVTYAEHSYYLFNTLNNETDYHYTANSHITLANGFFSNPKNGHEVLFEIDSYNLSPPTIGTTGGASNNNTYGVVGTLGGNLDISLLGGAVYSIPIELPDGLGGIKPPLSISYNSQGRNGLLGWGWELCGISSITRTGGTQYHDGYVSAVNYNDDRFCLDGQRLMMVGNGSYGSQGASYRTEQDQMSKIVSYHESGIIGPSYFKVWAADGKILYYGSSADSKALMSSQNHVNVWLLKKVEDRYGNQMVYYYLNTTDSYRIDRITYSGNSNDGIDPAFTIEFQYKERDDIEISFVGDCIKRNNALLDRIAVKNSGTTMCSYGFTYQQPQPQNGYPYPLLSTIQFSAGQEHLNPTKIQWGTNNYNNNTYSNLVMDVSTETIENAFSNAIKFSGDFNGDGFTDVISLQPNWFGVYPAADVFINKGKGVDGKLKFELATSIQLNANISWIHVADFNGDGMDDFLFSYRTRRSFPFPDTIDTDIYLSTHTASGNISFNRYQAPFCKVHHDMVETHLIGDFFGEGKCSFLIQTTDDSSIFQYSILYTYNEAEDRFQYQTFGSYIDANRFFPGDYNGDGITEILYKKKNGSTCIAQLTADDGTLQFSEQYAGSPENWDDCFPGDFNGDGLLDALFYTNGSSHPWNIWLSNRTGLSTNCFTLPTSFPYGSLGHYLFSLDQPHHTSQYIKVGDYDGNGCSDISLYYDNKFYVFYGPLRENGTSSPFSNTQSISTQQFNFYDNMSVCIGNFLGQEGLSFLGNTTLSHLPPMSWRHEVKSIVNGMGQKTEFAYDYLMPNPNNPSENDFYKLESFSSNHTMQIFCVSIPMRGLKSVTTYNVKDKPVKTQCFYEGALLHKQGKGFLSFNRTRQEDYCNNQLQKTTIRQYDVFYSNDIMHTMLSEEDVYDKNNRLMAKSTYSNYLFTHLKNSKTYIPLSSETKEEYDMEQPDRLLKKEINEITVSTHCSHPTKYDDILSITQKAKGITDHHDYNLVSSCEFQETTQTVYAPDILSAWLINRPSKINQIIHRNGDYDDICSQRNISYDNNKPYQIASVLELPNDGSQPNDPLAKRTDYLYDPVGNIIFQTINTPNANLEPRRELFEYSKTYGRRLLTKHTNALNEEALFTYDPTYNYRNSSTDCHGLVTQYERDPLNVTSITIHPDGTMSYKAIRWASGYYYSEEKETGKPTKITKYALNGENIGSRSYDINGETVFTEIKYDDLGRIIEETLPKRSGENEQCIAYEYDEHNQINRINHPDGTYETIEQDGNLKNTTFYTVDGNTQTESKTFNVMGWVVKSTDADGNNVINDYYADGKPKWYQIEGNDETKIEMSYDALGNRISLFDPNYGLTTCEYNAFNELTLQTTPKMDETSFFYDALGNLIRRIETDKKKNKSETTEWLYGQEQENHGLLTRIVSQNQVIEHEYDSLLRLRKTTENCFGDMYCTSYLYDKASRVSSITYPSNYTVSYAYTSEGYLRCVMDAEGTTLWKTSETNALHQPTKYITGNGFVTQLQYDGENHRLTSIHTTHEDEIIQDYHYEYDGFANMIFRSDSKNNLSESFAYDALNRLTSVTDNSGTSNFSYDPLGRMIAKTSPNGTVFSHADYSGPKPHAIKSALAPSGVFPQERMDLVFNSFDKVSSISEGTNQVAFEYGYDHQRIRTTERIDGKTRSKTYVGNCEFIHRQGSNPMVWTFLSGPAGVFAVAETVNGNTKLHYIHKDHLGSWTTISNSKGLLEQEEHFDAWGNCNIENGLMFDRGYTGHEHINGMNLINMNGRLYDPVTSSMLSPDNNVQLPDFTQNLNRYSYCLNNPLNYVDPDGNSFIGSALVFYCLFGTDFGYELQKFLSPAAFHLDFHLGTQQVGIGFDMSLGVPKSSPLSARAHFGATYCFYSYDNSYCGVEYRVGMELYAFGFIGISGTYYDSDETSQITNSLILGNENWGITYENDYMFHIGDNTLSIFASDNGDRYRSAAAKIRIGFFQVGVNLFTGDPGASHYNRNVYYDPSNNKATYGMGRNGDNPDEFRAGVFYVGYGPIRIGRNSEQIRNLFQNRFAHDFLCKGDSPYFKVLDRPAQNYFYFGSGTGNSLW